MSNISQIAAMSVSDFAKWASVGRTTAWAQIKEGNLRAFKVGRRTLVSVEEATAWLARRPPAR